MKDAITTNAVSGYEIDKHRYDIITPPKLFMYKKRDGFIFLSWEEMPESTQYTEIAKYELNTEISGDLRLSDILELQNLNIEGVEVIYGDGKLKIDPENWPDWVKMKYGLPKKNKE